jgi:hypothetical protein
MPVRHAEWRVRSSQGIKFSSYKRRRGTWALARNGLRNHGGVFARTVRVHGSCPTVVLEQHVVGIASERDRSPRDLSSPPETQGGLGDMSSYATYCQHQATDCARRARLARSPDIVAYYQALEERWLSLAEHAQERRGDADGQASKARDTSRRFGARDTHHTIRVRLNKLYEELRAHCGHAPVGRPIGSR